MKSRICYRDAGYQQGFLDGKRTRGKIKKSYIENVFNSETQNLSYQEILKYKMGWQDGFVDAVRGAIKNVVAQENCVKKHLDKLFSIA